MDAHLLASQDVDRRAGELRKPYLHFHTQFYRDIPWESIDMDYMNLHQSAHGDREFGFINTRMRKNRKIVVGHWQDPEALAAIGAWCRVAAAWQDGQGPRSPALAITCGMWR